MLVEEEKDTNNIETGKRKADELDNTQPKKILAVDENTRE